MANPSMARCGIDCEACEYRAKMNCLGCQAAKGKLFWGECALAKCCMDKGHDHCGQCQDFPCDTLKEYSYDSEHGDNGERIRNLEALRSS
jgi:hypothetical protein